MTPYVAATRLARRGIDARIAYRLYAQTPEGDTPEGDKSPPVLFVRGLGMTTADSHRFATVLSSRDGGRPVATFDYLGFGNSSLPRESWGKSSIEDMAQVDTCFANR